MMCIQRNSRGVESCLSQYYKGPLSVWWPISRYVSALVISLKVNYIFK